MNKESWYEQDQRERRERYARFAAMPVADFFADWSDELDRDYRHLDHYEKDRLHRERLLPSFQEYLHHAPAPPKSVACYLDHSNVGFPYPEEYDFEVVFPAGHTHQSGWYHQSRNLMWDRYRHHHYWLRNSFPEIWRVRIVHHPHGTCIPYRGDKLGNGPLITVEDPKPAPPPKPKLTMPKPFRDAWSAL